MPKPETPKSDEKPSANKSLKPAQNQTDPSQSPKPAPSIRPRTRLAPGSSPKPIINRSSKIYSRSNSSMNSSVKDDTQSNE